MRDFLTGIAIILIVVLTTVLVAPYFVDWNGQREFLEARLSHALAQKVTIGGTIDLKLLPTPYLVLDQVVVGGDEAPIKVGVRHLNLELAVAPLLHGEFDIVEARLREPTIRISLESDHTLPLLPAAPAFSADVRFDRISVSDGTLAVTDPESGRTFVLDHLDLDAEAGSFAGPFKVSGTEGPAERRTGFKLTTAAAKDGRTRAHLVIAETTAHVGADFDGTLAVRPGGPAPTQSFEGKLVMAGHVARGARDPIAWKLAGPLRADPRQARLEGGELRLGSDEAGLTFQAEAQTSFGPGSKASLQLEAKQLDIDRLAGIPAEGTPPPPPQLPDLAELRSIVAATRPPVPTEVDLAVDAATYAGEALSGIAARLTLGEDGAHPLRLAVDGPGGAHVAADGRLVTGADPSFDGRIDVAAEDLPRALDWARRVAPSLPWSGQDVAFERVRASGPIAISAKEASSNDLLLALDRTKLAGKARFTYAAGQRAKLVVDAKSEALDLDHLPSLDRLRSGGDLVDLEVRLDAKAIKVSRVGDGALESGRIRLDVGKTGDRLVLNDLRLDDLGGATVAATGEVAPDGGRLSVTLDARRLEAAAGLARQLAPGALSEALVARAFALAPAKLKIEASLGGSTNGPSAPSRLAVAGTLGATKVVATGKPDPDRSGETVLSVALDAPEAEPMLRQLGFGTVPIQTLGAGRLKLAAHGRAGEPGDMKMDAEIGATKIGIAGRFAFVSASPDGSGSLRVQSPDLTPLLQTLAVAFPDLTGKISADMRGRLTLADGKLEASNLDGHVGDVATRGALSWRRSPADGVPLTGSLDLDRLSLSHLVGLALGHDQPASGEAAWSRQPFTVGLVDPPRAAVSLAIRELEVVPGVRAKNASLDLGIAPNQVSIQKLAAELSQGRLEGGASLRRDGRQASVEGHLTLDKVAVALPGAVDTELGAKLDFAGSGTSASGLMSSLAGSGEASARRLRITGAGPAALVRIFDDVESDVLAVDQDAIVHAYAEAAKAPLEIDAMRFGLSLASGVVHLDAKAPDDGGAARSKVDAALDLARLHLDVHAEEALRELPKNWSGAPPTIIVTLDDPLAFDKPPARPSRSVDVSGFVNAVAARALARETARIEAYELDIRERAFFNARLQSEHRREEERQKAEDDAREAEAERKARAEAVKQERLRKDQAAKAAREEQEKTQSEERERDTTQGPPQPPP